MGARGGVRRAWHLMPPAVIEDLIEFATATRQPRESDGPSSDVPLSGV